jgi:hypothetical protein|tara:strand:+ start:318 stop:500 length:183 start_codon:yes stop_codon:yes gene_type:complete
MNLDNINKTISSKKMNNLNNINDYIIQIDYFDKNGTKKYNNNIPLRYVFNQKKIKINHHN